MSSYVVEVSSDTGTQEYAADATELVVDGLVNGESYALRVAAVNAAGRGEWSLPTTATPRAQTLDRPRRVRAEQDGRRVTISWRAPRTGEPEAYVVAASINGRRYRIVAEDVDGLRTTWRAPRRAVEIRIRVAAIDASGRGPWARAR